MVKVVLGFVLVLTVQCATEVKHIQGICLHEQHFKTVKELKKDTQAILNSLSVYKEVIKMNRQVTNDIKWIMKESHGEKEVSRILRLLTQDVKGICGMTVVKDCTDIQKTKQKSGVYKIYPDKSGGVKAYCDMAPETGGGWTVIQRRYDGSVNFQRTWAEYENGFGNVNGEYWLGNKYIHRLTSTGTYELKVVLTGSSKYIKDALYRTFVVGNEASKYKLTVGDYSGTAGISNTSIINFLPFKKGSKNGFHYLKEIKEMSTNESIKENNVGQNSLVKNKKKPDYFSSSLDASFK
ncbi:Hypothetical predicted protein [Mytilus galloprovincialis]|uniref:Fibrinogen C-terminal domain-containing protein n=1 Tax=Mytilus galloprovincialis TaxID=29158 RepID=A0A8B6GYC8_MYTGA|nr:Hypothetical predicted protein [Mytilus galloprovincialis]